MSRRGRPARIALTASLLLHGAALAWLAWLAGRPVAPRREAAAIVVELRPRVEPAPTPAPPPPRPRERPPRDTSGTPATSTPAAPPRAPAAAPPRSWFEAQGLGADRPADAADLRVRPAPPTAGSLGGPARPGGPGGDPDTPQARVDAMVAGLVGRERVRTALDPAWLPLAERLRTAWKPGWEALDAETSGHAPGDSALVRSLPGYLAAAERFGRGGRPGAADGTFGERRSEAGRVVDREAAAASQGSAPLPFPAERSENHFERTYEVVVAVAHAEDGAVERVTVRRSSGHAGLDRQALATAREALAAWDWRPPAGPRRTSVWAFVAVLGVVPPVPALGCPLDVLWTLRVDRCAYPLKKLASGRVEFLALE